MYVCDICGEHSPPRQKKIVHRIMRPSRRDASRLEIDKELALCPGCNAEIEGGKTIAQLLDSRRAASAAAAAPRRPKVLSW